MRSKFLSTAASSIALSVASLSLSIVVAAPAVAQETSSAVRGTVSSPAGPVANASVTITHEPSGTVARTTSDAGGNFSTQGLRIGGPVTVRVDADGFEAVEITDLNLQAGNTFRLPVELKEASAIVVTATLSGGITQTSDGPTTSLGRVEIETAASINRDIRDLARRDPLVTIDLTNSRTIEIAGNNGRLNRFSVDGMQMSDDFGLNNGGLPTNRGPVPFDAIEQFTVKVAPYDIAEGDMQGGAINVVLKSGGNKLHGGGFFSYTDDGLTSNRSRTTAVSLDFSSKQYGGWLSGPILQDKLYFMVAYEKTTEGQPLEAGFGPGFANQIPGLTQSVIDQVTATAKSRYGYDTLGLIATTNERDEKLVTKIDANLSETQRASLTYIRNVGSNQFQQGTFLTAPYALGYQSNGYELTEEVNSGTFELNSTWSDKLSTNLRASYRDYNRGQSPFGALFPQMEVCTDATSGGSATSCNGTRLFFGPDVSRHSNALNTENLSLDFTARLEAGDHSFRFMTGYTKVDVFNLFLQRSLGDFYFDSLADFTAGNANRLRYGNAVPSNDPNDAAASFSTIGWTFGVQDDWQVADSLQITAGVRYDVFDNTVIPPLNANLLARSGLTNRSTFKGRGVVQPRFALNWEATDRLILRAGAGIFAGGTPDVFLSNVYSNTGQLTNSVDIARATCLTQGSTCDALNGITGGKIPTSAVNYLTTNTASLALAPTDLIDPKLKLANKLKVTFQGDYNANLGPLGDDWMLGVQFVYDKTLQGYLWTDIRSVPIGVLPDGRVRYGPIGGAASTNRDLMLTNTSDGRGIFGTFRFEKRWEAGLSIEGSYTRSDVKDRSALTSSTSSSNYQNNAFVDPNYPEYGRSIYELLDQYKFGVNYRKALFGDNKTSLALFGEYRSGRPYSVTMLDNSGGRGAVFGTVGNLGNMLLYVPTGANDPLVQFGSHTVGSGASAVTVTAAQNEAAFNALVDQLGIGEFRGKILPKNSQTSSNFFKVDFSFRQELPVPAVNGGKFELFVDIENVLNLLDRDWGSLRQVQGPYNAAVARVSCATTVGSNCTKYQYTNVAAPSELLQTRQSLYGIRVGAKVKF